MIQRTKGLLIAAAITLTLLVVVISGFAYYTKAIYNLGKEKGRAEVVAQLEESTRVKEKENKENLQTARTRESKVRVEHSKRIETTSEEYHEATKDLSDVPLGADFIRMWNEDNRCFLQEGTSGCSVD